ncbi:MAG: porin [Rhodocyclaceae bacterium]
MQKKIIALAVAGLMSGAAFAQTNVTVYGAADVTFDNVKATGATASANNLPARNRISANSSILGFKGTEDLGGGLKAVFQFEAGVSNDTTVGTTSNSGANVTNFFNRDSFVGVAGGFGTVAAGILTGPTRALGAALDPFLGATGITSNSALLGKLGGQRFAVPVADPATGGGNATAANCSSSTTCTSIFDTRWNNAIAYISPNMAGFTVTAAYVANENKTRDGLDGGANERNTYGYDLGARYENGPIMAGLTYNKAKIGDTANTQASDTRLAARYNFGAGTVGLMWDRVKLEATGVDQKRNAWFLPVTFNVTGNGKIVAQYGKAGDVTGTSDTGASMFALGYEHSLSKRTVVKAVWSQISNEAAAYYDFGVNASGNTTAGADPRGFQVGVRHSF